MKRFFGLMPRDEIFKKSSFRDKYNLVITIDAGPNGWTIRYADGGTEYKDEVDTTENNFQKAYSLAIKNLGELTEIEEHSFIERCER